MRVYDDKNRSTIWLNERTLTDAWELGDFKRFPKMDPTKDYRLVFSGVGTVLTVQWFNLTDGTPPDTYQFPGDSLTAGEIGFVVFQGPAVDCWLDNFIAVGTTP